MSYNVQVMQRTQEDVLQIVEWINERSMQGASTWYAAYERMLERLQEQPLACGQALEAKQLGRDLREAMFKTPQGNVYRGVFLVEGESVFLLRVRGPGQSPLTRADL